MSEPHEQAKQNLIAALNDFAMAFGARFDGSGKPEWVRFGGYWEQEFLLDGKRHRILSDEHDVWVPLWIFSINEVAFHSKFQATPAQFVQMWRILKPEA